MKKVVETKKSSRRLNDTNSTKLKTEKKTKAYISRNPNYKGLFSGNSSTSQTKQNRNLYNHGGSIKKRNYQFSHQRGIKMVYYFNKDNFFYGVLFAWDSKNDSNNWEFWNHKIRSLKVGKEKCKGCLAYFSAWNRLLNYIPPTILKYNNLWSSSDVWCI